MENRTIKQNSSLHLWYQQIADELNNAGYDMVSALKILKKSNDIAIPWSRETVKERLYKKILEAYKIDNKTSKMTKKDIEVVNEVFIKMLSDVFGICIPFPSTDNLID